jgi:hypothetical protein
VRRRFALALILLLLPQLAAAQFGSRDGLIGPQPSPGLGFNFLTATLPSGVTLTRSTTGSLFDVNHLFQNVAANVARFTYDDTGLRGLLVEPAGQNEVRNSTASAGLVAGSPGTPPNSWTITAAPAGLTRTLAGGTEDGMSYVDIRLNGTSTIALTFQISFDASRPATVVGDVWQVGYQGRLLTGAVLPAAPITFQFSTFDSGSATISTVNGLPIVLPVGGSLRNSRYREAYSIVAAGAASFRSTFVVTVAVGEVMDFTMRFSEPQMVKSAVPQSAIVTTTVAAPRAADVATIPLANGTYSIQVERHAGGVTYEGQVVSGGTWTIPTDPSPVRTVTARQTGP